MHMFTLKSITLPRHRLLLVYVNIVAHVNTIAYVNTLVKVIKVLQDLVYRIFDSIVLHVGLGSNIPTIG